MLKEIFIENYKSLKNVTVQFKDGLNIIIGKNGSGKSNLLEFIKSTISIAPFIQNTNGNDKYPKYDFSYSFIYKELEKEVILSIETKNENKILNNNIDTVTNVSISKKYKNEDNYFLKETFLLSNIPAQLNKLIAELHSIKSLNTESIKFNIPYKIAWLNAPNTYTINTNRINIDGVGVKNSLYFTVNGEYGFHFAFNFERFFERKLNSSNFDLNTENATIDAKNLLNESFTNNLSLNYVNNNLNNFSPIEELRISPNINIYKIEDKILIENLTFEFKIGGTWMPWSYLSDGTKRLFYIIAEVCSQANGLILIEEPELGIHPHQLFLLMKFIKEQSESKQIILSTHSPTILDALNSDELDRIIIARIENGKSQFYNLNEKEIAEAKEYMDEVADLSYYWQHSELENND